MSRYCRTTHEQGADSSVLQCERKTDKLVAVTPQLPGNVIVVHGVNDVGVSFEQVEKGLCAGLNERLGWGDLAPLQPASYRMPTPEDAKRLEPDPDAVFFKRQAQPGQHSPVIPFYWGYRAAPDNFTPDTRTDHGQAVDRWGNRLDKDFSKGGGPFGNATSTLPDMWNRGFGAGPADAVDRLSKDPLRPVLKAPGRLYMVLAAQRLAALVAMIRDYDPDDVVSLVAHSQGCMLSLLAQAFLLEQGLRPADTLVLTHPPYSLVDDVPWTSDAAEMFSGGEDAVMRARYPGLAGRQTLYARLQTLVNIVQGVVGQRHATPAFAELKAPQHQGLVGTRWEPGEDRDNRGKVYLYFCPEDMTVALDNVQGIGWQGVPDHQKGSRMVDSDRRSVPGPMESESFTETYRCQPLKALGSGFFQRVFTARQRVAQDAPAGAQPQPVLVGAAPHDHPLRVKGEDDHGHVASGAATLRASLPEVDWPPARSSTLAALVPAARRRSGIRRITGEALRRPVVADMYAGALTLPNQPQGAHEGVDPIDAAIASTSRYGLQPLPSTVIDDPRPAQQRFGGDSRDQLAPWECQQIEKAMNQDKPPGELRKVLSGFHAGAERVRVVCSETANEARLRQQQSVAARSFHGAIFGSALNHKQVTAYDVAIGGGKAVSDPAFRAYLCAVADWRLKKPKNSKDKLRPGILAWDDFLDMYSEYYGAETEEHKRLIYGNCVYYSTGVLPEGLPLPPGGMPRAVVSETMQGQRIDSTQIADAEVWLTDEEFKQRSGRNGGTGALA
ncbi:T6SS effector phospholipase Tle3 domain-containing protein [Azohydromonas aeria]|uniref:T6SS effector phospholipase Tle3 domain-containing protein n=1 Tax=Azohydromonas aeria TaxID=2590212 RepID=UPI0012F8D4E2|nr:DUF3274 domain-containing protein [Azohydromonas aeria]